MATSSSDSDYVKEEYNEDEDVEKEIPGWMQSFLQAPYSTSCQKHDILEKNALNKFCVTCNAVICKNCIQSKIHEQHDLLSVYHHSGKDVVPLNQMKNHIRCSQIQVYKCNRQWVLALHLPQNSASTSGAQLNENEACKACKRKLHKRDAGYHFCSITCMVENERGEAEIEVPPAARRHRRKGIPHRAPHGLM